jgi:hypothetical protein
MKPSFLAGFAVGEGAPARVSTTAGGFETDDPDEKPSFRVQCVLGPFCAWIVSTGLNPIARQF